MYSSPSLAILIIIFRLYNIMNENIIRCTVLFQICMSFLKLGIITIFLSDSLVSGYTAAAAFTILITQIKFLFGLNATEAFVEPGLFTTPRVRDVFC